MANFDENYPVILEEIARAAADSGREAGDITLLAATKTVPLEVINHAIGRGLSCIGENRVQELLEKYDGLDKGHCDVQFIGRLQTNKVKYLIGKVSCIQSLDSMKLAREISRLSSAAGLVTQVLVEVNIGREENKGGVLPEALLEFVDEARQLPGLHISGLMAIPPADATPEMTRRFFAAMRELLAALQARQYASAVPDTLSMGMSGDYAAAIEEGATIVRIGTAIYGARDYAKQ